MFTYFLLIIVTVFHYYRTVHLPNCELNQNHSFQSRRSISSNVTSVTPRFGLIRCSMYHERGGVTVRRTATKLFFNRTVLSSFSEGKPKRSRAKRKKAGAERKTAEPAEPEALSCGKPSRPCDIRHAIAAGDSGAAHSGGLRRALRRVGPVGRRAERAPGAAPPALRLGGPRRLRHVRRAVRVVAAPAGAPAAPRRRHPLPPLREAPPLLRGARAPLPAGPLRRRGEASAGWSTAPTLSRATSISSTISRVNVGSDDACVESVTLEWFRAVRDFVIETVSCHRFHRRDVT